MQTKSLNVTQFLNLFKLLLIGFLGVIIFGNAQYAPAANDQSQLFSISRLEPDSIKVLPAPAKLKSEMLSSPIPVSKLNPIPLTATAIPAPSPFNSVQDKKSGIKSFSGWTTLFSDGFESSFPGTNWSLSGNPTWGKVTSFTHTGSGSVWCAKGGTRGLDPAVSNYTSNMGAAMVYGPFSLTSCTTAQVNFYLWNDSEPVNDFFAYARSNNGSSFSGPVVSGTTGGWKSYTYNLGDDYRGQPQVWFACFFFSDSTNNYPGAYVDDVQIQKYLAELPNLAPYQPYNWSSPLVVGSNATTVMEGTVYAGLTSYISWAAENNGTISTNTEVYFKLVVDGNDVGSWYIGMLNTGYYVSVGNMPYIFTTVGTHTVQLITDDGNLNLESNEADNNYIRTKYVKVVKPEIDIQPLSFNKTIVQGTMQSDILAIANLAPINTTLNWLIAESVTSSGNLAGLYNKTGTRDERQGTENVNLGLNSNIDGEVSTPVPSIQNKPDLKSMLGANSWSILSSMSIGRSRPTAAAVNGKIYVIGGQDSSGRVIPVVMYDPETNTWTNKANKPTPASNLCCGVIGTKIYVPGGYDSTANYISSLEIYDTEYDTWTTGASLPRALCGAAAVAFNGQIYVFGGNNSSGSSNTCYVYNPYGDSWSQISSMNYARAYGGAALVNNKIYVIGGYSDLAYCEEYDIFAGTWTIKSPMNLGRGGVGVCAVDGYIYAVGGGWFSYYSSCERYNPISDTWTMSTEIIPNLNYGRMTLGIAVDNKTIYALGGWNGSNFMNSVESYTVDPLDWLDESQKYGTTNSGYTTLVKLTFDATSLPLGDTTGYIIVTSNDSERTPIVIPITLHVVAPSEINVAPTSISKTVGRGTISYSTLTIQNSGGSPLTHYIYESIATTGWSFSKVRSTKYPSTSLRINQVSEVNGITPEVSSSSDKPDNYIPILSQSNSFTTLAPPPMQTVLLLQDSQPWGTYSNESILTANGISYVIASSALIPSIDLTPYKIVMISSDQSSTFYATYLAYTSKFDSYVANGGILEFHATSNGWAGGLFYGPLPGGVTINHVYENYNIIADVTHPAVAGVPNILWGNYASHADFANLVTGTDIITRELDRNLPTLIEYKYGNGRVVASTQPLEVSYAWDWDAGIILTNLIPHSVRLSRDNINWLEATPQSGSTLNGTYSLITVTLDATNVTAGITTTAYLQIFSNDPDETWISIPVTMYVAPPDIAVQPTYIAKTVAQGSITYSSLTISNTGIGILDYYIHESIDSASWGFTKISAAKGLYHPISESPYSAMRNLVGINTKTSNAKYDPNAATAVGLRNTGNDPVGTSSLFYWILGTAISSFPTGLVGAWGVGQDVGHLWVGNQGFDGGGDDFDYQFNFAGKATGTQIDTNPWIAGIWGGDMAFDGTYLWQVHVGGDNGIYQLNPNTGLVVSSTQSVPWASSQRGVAFDPDTKTLWVGGWNDYSLYNITTTGSVITTYNTGLNIAGLGWHRESRTLWMITNSSPDMIYRYNPNTFATITSFAAPLGFGGSTSYNAGAGLEMIGDHLWAVNQIDNTLVEIDCGITSNIDWLAETPQSGSVPANNKSSVQLEINATSLPVGLTTTAYLHIYSNDPDENPVMVRVRITCISDTTKPVSACGSISPYWRKSTPISVPYNAYDNGQLSSITLYYRYQPGDSTTWSSWSSFQTVTTSKMTTGGTFSFTAPRGQGKYEFYTRAKDWANQTESAPATADAACGYDTTPPTVGTISINTGASYTQSMIVWVRWAGASDTFGVASVGISNTSGSGYVWSKYTSGNGRTWNLTAGNGTKTVYEVFRDNAGNQSVQTTDTIILTSSKILTIQSSPQIGTYIVVSPKDYNSQSSDYTNFLRNYNVGTTVNLYAPQYADGHKFIHWTKNNVQYSTNTNITITMDSSYQVTAEYTLNRYGTFNASSDTSYWYWEKYGDGTAAGTLSRVTGYGSKTGVGRFNQKPGEKGKLTQIYSVLSTGWYTAKANVATDVSTMSKRQKVYLYLQEFDSSTAVAATGNLVIQPGNGGLPAAGTWKPIEISFYAQHTLLGVQVVGINPSSSGVTSSLYLDDIWVYPGASNLTTKKTITNSSFASGTTGWAIELYADGTGPGTWSALSSWASHTAVLRSVQLGGQKGKASQSYTASTSKTLGSVWVYSSATSMSNTQKIYLYIYSYDSSYTKIVESGNAILQSGKWTPGVWRQLRFEYTPISTKNAVQIVGINPSGKPSGTLYFDEVELKQ